MINIETAIQWMESRRGIVTYSMDYRNGPNSYDCSSAVYYALRAGGASDNGWAVNTEYAHDWLIANGFTLIAENTSWDAQRGDVTIWGARGYSSGGAGHMMLFVDDCNIIHCNYAYNGITVNGHDWLWELNGCPYFYTYRYTGNTSTLPGETDVTVIARQVLAGGWGNGSDRAERLTAAGYDYDAVQAEVNRLLSGDTVVDLTEIALQVIQGDWGNGADRVARLRAAGYNSEEVQAEVNRLFAEN